MAPRGARSSRLLPTHLAQTGPFWWPHRLLFLKWQWRSYGFYSLLSLSVPQLGSRLTVCFWSCSGSSDLPEETCPHGGEGFLYNSTNSCCRCPRPGSLVSLNIQFHADVDIFIACASCKFEREGYVLPMHVVLPWGSFFCLALWIVFHYANIRSQYSFYHTKFTLKYTKLTLYFLDLASSNCMCKHATIWMRCVEKLCILYPIQCSLLLLLSFWTFLWKNFMLCSVSRRAVKPTCSRSGEK